MRTRAQASFGTPLRPEARSRDFETADAPIR